MRYLPTYLPTHALSTHTHYHTHYCLLHHRYASADDGTTVYYLVQPPRRKWLVRKELRYRYPGLIDVSAYYITTYNDSHKL